MNRQKSNRDIGRNGGVRHRAGDVLLRDTLLNAAWDVGYFGTSRTHDQHVAQLHTTLAPADDA